MAEYINKQELIKNIVNTPISWDYPVTSEHLTGSAKRQNEILTLIDDMPTTDVRENKNGKWIKANPVDWDEETVRVCDNCFGPSLIPFNFCPHCRADMKDGRGDND